MNPNMKGHDHGGKSHLFGMLGIGALVLVVLLGAGRSFQQALPLALLLACPLMMVGMIFMMRGANGQPQSHNAADHNDAATADHHDHDAPVEWQDTPTSTSAQSARTTTLS